MPSKKIARDYIYSFPAIRGVQAGREYYTTMCPLKLIPDLFKFDYEDLPPELRAQRILYKGRIPQISRYIVENQDNYIFSSITASVDGEVQFDPISDDTVGAKIGTLSVPMDAKFIINDGQHRCAAIKEALKNNSSLAYETISVVLFVDAGLKLTQQMFADLNRYAVRPTKSLGILYDHRDPMARLVNLLIKEVPIFKGMTETAKSSISNRSRKLFTLSSIYQASKRLLQKKTGEEVNSKEEKLLIDFWNEVAQNMPDWLDAVNRKVAPSELRRDYIHAHGIALQALAIAGCSLIKTTSKGWETKLSKIKKIDWLRENADLWEGRALIGGSLNKSQKNVILTANVIKKVMGLPLEPKEQEIEDNYEKGQYNS
ncbi:MAG: DNA sulfur modification protein DndB [Desulfobacteraceae bacterium]|nr:DNA sulfur modification protein DndB [Desulfobacteraceae bacterium]